MNIVLATNFLFLKPSTHVKISKEIQIGFAVVMAALIFWWGNRVFSNLPVFSQGHTFYADLTHTQGLVSGSVVDIHGVGVGSITDIILNPQGPRIQFFVDKDIVIPYGTYVTAGGPGLFSDARLAIILGPSDSEAHQPGDLLPARDQTDLLGTLTEQTPNMLSRADTVLGATARVVSTTLDLLSQPQSALRQTLNSVNESAEALTAILSDEQGSLASVLGHIDELSSSLITLVEDSLANSAGEFEATMARLDDYIEELEETTVTLRELISKINNGDGTLGRMVNDDSLYTNINQSAAALRRILEKFEEDPEHYMQHLKIIEIF